MSFQKFWAKVTKLLKETIQFSKNSKAKINQKIFEIKKNKTAPLTAINRSYIIKM